MPELDLDDPMVREMADRDHTPQEMWNMAGQLLGVTCTACGLGWPCKTREALRERADKRRCVQRGDHPPTTTCSDCEPF